jgi:hypothetical protein
MRTDSDRNLSAEADPNPARKTRERVLTMEKIKSIKTARLKGDNSSFDALFISYIYFFASFGSRITFMV